MSACPRPILFFVCLVLNVFSALPRASAQVTRSPSVDPLNGSTFSSSTYGSSSTLTSDITYTSATGRVSTAISGVGPSVMTASYSFSYEVPTSTLSGTALSAVYSSLAANHMPTAATSALVPSSSNLQIVAGFNSASTLSVGSMHLLTAAAMGTGILTILLI